MTVKKKLLKGIVKRNPDGYGFLIPDQKDHPDVYIPRHSMDGVMTNDYVLADISPESGGQKFRGDIVEIIKRATLTVVGKFKFVTKSYGILKDESNAWGNDLVIEQKNSMNCAEGDLVAAQITQYPEKGKELVGKVIEIIGNIEDPMNDIKRVAMTQQITMKFPEAVIRESKKFRSEPIEKEFKGRKDIRLLNLVTIDGKTAKDFDDAVFVEHDETGFRLIVAIADVSHYVKPGTDIDHEAFLRGNSVYFPNFVIPMLPEVLSNGLCSLNPNVPRLCLVAEMRFDFTGVRLESRFYEAVMESKSRITYGEAQDMIEGRLVEKHEHVRANILKCADLAKILMTKRFKDGSLDLDIPETTLEIDASGVPVDVIRSERLFSHRLIEELMLAANVAVAEFLSHSKIPSLYRIHESPNETAIKMLERYLHNFGGRIKLNDGMLQKRLTRALQEFSGKPEAQVLNILTLRSMSQAKYSITNLGHFGLGFENYTHFTSPIRRYPDLIVHRLLKSQILENRKYATIAEDDLSTAATWLSSCEQKAAKAERQIHAIKKARFMERFLGDEFEGIISSVVRFGVFVLLREYEIDGLIKIDELSSQRLEFDENTLSLYNKKTGLRFSIGDTIKIKVVSADPELGQINFMPLELVAKREKQSLNRVKEDQRRRLNSQRFDAKNKNNDSSQSEQRQRIRGSSKKSFAERLFKKKNRFKMKSSTDNQKQYSRQEPTQKKLIPESNPASEKSSRFIIPGPTTEYKAGTKNNSDQISSEAKVSHSNRNSLMDKLDQAILAREKNHAYSFGNRSKPNDDKVIQAKEKHSGSNRAKTESSRKNTKKRSSVKNHRRGIR